MSVIVEFNIADGHAYRRFEIRNVTKPRPPGWDDVCTYVVDRFNDHFRSDGGHRQATFEHLRSNDVTQLVAAAGEALRAKYGYV